MWVIRKVKPEWPKKIKEGAYKLWDRVVGTPKNIGKSVNSGIDSIRKTASTGIKNYTNRVKDNAIKLVNNVTAASTQSMNQLS